MYQSEHRRCSIYKIGLGDLVYSATPCKKTLTVGKDAYSASAVSVSDQEESNISVVTLTVGDNFFRLPKMTQLRVSIIRYIVPVANGGLMFSRFRGQ